MKRKLASLAGPVGLLPFAATLFFDVSGGPLGLEPLVGASGPGMALLLVLLVPFLYAIPSALMTAELCSAMPHNGGYYVWVKRAFGEGAAFVCSFWTLIYCVVDAAVYPVAAVKTGLNLVESLGWGVFDVQVGGWHLPAQWILAAGIVVVFTVVNLLGIKAVGASSTLFGVLTLAPFGVMVALALSHVHFQTMPLVNPGQKLHESALAGLAVVVWNYLGWDSLSTVAGEVHDAPKTIPRALASTLPAIVVTYVLVILGGWAVLPNASQWKEGVWPQVAGAAGGHGLATWMGLSLMVSSLGLFTATLLGASRLPLVFAHDGLLPRSFARLHPRLGTPVVPILLVAGCVLALVGRSFGDLIEMDVLVYTTALMMEFAALVWLRIKEPDMPRPFRVPGGLAGVTVVSVMPLVVLVLMAVDQARTADWRGYLVAGAFFVSGPALYLVARELRRRG